MVNAFARLLSKSADLIIRDSKKTGSTTGHLSSNSLRSRRESCGVSNSLSCVPWRHSIDNVFSLIHSWWIDNLRSWGVDRQDWLLLFMLTGIIFHFGYSRNLQGLVGSVELSSGESTDMILGRTVSMIKILNQVGTYVHFSPKNFMK